MFKDWGPATLAMVVLVVIGAVTGGVAVLASGFSAGEYLDWIKNTAYGVAGLGGARAAFEYARR